MTYDSWDYGYFSTDQLERARAYRVDDEHPEELFPDGGEKAEIYETEFAALEEFLSDNDPETTNENQ